MRQILFTAIITALIGASSYAQQEAQYSQYMNNNFIVNPAEGGTEEFIDLKFSYRSQWQGIDGAPKTLYVSGHAPLNKHTSRFDDVKQLPFHGVGGYIASDQIGPTSRTSAYASYAYHLPISAHNDFVISFGAFLGFKQYKVDAEKVKFFEEEVGNGNTDYALAGTSSKFVPDATAGIWGYSNKYYFGIATFQLFRNKVSFYDGEEDVEEGRLAMHHFITAGYKIDLDEKKHWFVVPSFVVKNVSAAPVSVDLNCKVRYKDLYWGGFSYRHGDAMIGMIGITAKKTLDISYSFDMTTSNLKSYNNGTHEILVGLRFPYHEADVPSQYW